MFTREELIALRRKAKEEVAMKPGEGIDQHWQRAFLRLSDAADCLDAMIARTEIKESKIPTA